MRNVYRSAGLLLMSLSLCVGSASNAYSAPSKIRVAGLTGILFAPTLIMKQLKLIDKHAKAAGLDVEGDYLTFTSGGAAADALISGNVDFIATGVSNLMLLWSKTKGEIKAVSAISGTNSVLVTRDPNVKTLADFTDKNRIAVNTLKVSNQAIYLQMALDKKFGDYKKLDSNMVQLGFAEGMQVMLSGSGAVDSHFAGPPYFQEELKDPKIHAVISSVEIVGPATNLLAATTRKYRDSNKEMVKVFLSALAEAQDLINNQPQKAAEVYLAETKEKFKSEEIAAQFKAVGNVFQTLPFGTQVTAAFMTKAGLISQKTDSWKDFFFPDLYDVPGADKAN